MTRPPGVDVRHPAVSRAAGGGGRVVDVLVWALCALLVVMSLYGVQLHCEGFGCMGKGLWWVLWAVVAVASGCIGLALRRWQANRGLPVRRSGWALVSLWAMVAGHFLYWLITTGLR